MMYMDLLQCLCAPTKVYIQLFPFILLLFSTLTGILYERRWRREEEFHADAMREMASIGWVMERRVSARYAINVAQSRLECEATAPCWCDCKMDE